MSRLILIFSLVIALFATAGLEQPVSAEVAAPPAKPPAGRGKPDFAIGSTFSRTVQKFTGITFLGDVIASGAADHVLSKRLGGKVKVRVKSYSLTDLVAGKIKSLKVKSAGGEYKNVELGDLEIASTTPIWYQYRHKKGERPGLKVPVMLDVKGQLNNVDIASALQSDKIAESLHGLKLDLPGLGEQQLQVVQPKVELGVNSIKIDATLITLGASPDTGVPIIITGRPVLKGDKVYISEMKVESPYIVEPEKFAVFLQDLFNPIFDFAKLDRKDHAFRLKQLAVKDENVEGSGQLLLVPKALAQAAVAHPVAPAVAPAIAPVVAPAIDAAVPPPVVPAIDAAQK